MDSRTRVRLSLEHREADRVPRDLASSRSTGIHVEAYREFRAGLGLADIEVRVMDFHQQLAHVDDDVVDALGVDVRAVGPTSLPSTRPQLVEDEDGTSYQDEWGVLRRKPHGGFYYDSVHPPLAGEIDARAVDTLKWPDPTEAARYAGMGERARAIAQVQKRAVHAGSICSGLIEGLFKLRGFEDAYMDLAADQALAGRLMERLLEIKLEYWKRALPLLGENVDVVGESDDLGGQRGLLFSPATYRSLVKPMHAELFRFIHANTDAKIFFHTCGAVRDLIPDLIEIGADILNPVQVTAAGMASDGLKRDFGRDIVFWGGGVDTQGVLAAGTADDVRADVRRHVGDLKPDGGFVFAAVHNIQARVPIANLLAMWDEIRSAGTYVPRDGSAER